MDEKKKTKKREYKTIRKREWIQDRADAEEKKAALEW